MRLRWDANNRMIVTESRSEVPAWAKKRLAFEYDYMGRRTVKRVESGYYGGTYGTTNTTTYVWDGWNIIAEVSRNSTTGQSTTNYYTWGLDLSGTLQGAGGVGGLALLSVNGTNALPVFDGNGNVMALVGSDGTVVAEYEYGPFGSTLKAKGPLARANPWRFSTKGTDGETGLVSYQLRDYSPSQGRWTSRDPMEEDGGINVYQAFENMPLDKVDLVGLGVIDTTSPSLMQIIASDRDLAILVNKTGITSLRSVAFWRQVRQCLVDSELTFSEYGFALRRDSVGNIFEGRAITDEERSANERAISRWIEYDTMSVSLRAAKKVKNPSKSLLDNLGSRVEALRKRKRRDVYGLWSISYANSLLIPTSPSVGDVGTFHVHPPYTQVTPSKENDKGDLPKLTALQELYSQMLGKQVKAWGLIAMPEPDKDCAVELFLYDEGAVWPSTNIRIKYK